MCYLFHLNTSNTVNSCATILLRLILHKYNVGNIEIDNLHC